MSQHTPKPAFTPGPWTVNPDMPTQVDVNSNGLTGDDYRADLLLEVDTRADAALIAASPDLYSACQRALALLQDPDGDAFEAAKVENLLASALAKAAGDT